MEFIRAGWVESWLRGLRVVSRQAKLYFRPRPLHLLFLFLGIPAVLRRRTTGKIISPRSTKVLT